MVHLKIGGVMQALFRGFAAFFWGSFVCFVWAQAPDAVPKMEAAADALAACRAFARAAEANPPSIPALRPRPCGRPARRPRLPFLEPRPELAPIRSIRKSPKKRRRIPGIRPAGRLGF